MQIKKPKPKEIEKKSKYFRGKLRKNSKIFEVDKLTFDLCKKLMNFSSTILFCINKIFVGSENVK